VAAASRNPNAPKIRDAASRWPIFAGAAILSGAALAVYANSFLGPFFFDDAPSIADNPTIRHLWPIGQVLCPPSSGGRTVAGRPMVNLSLAVNYALGGTGVAGYHALNLAIHVLAGLTLFGMVRRSFIRWRAMSARQFPAGGAVRIPGNDALRAAIFALAVALLWTLHPLQTESVSYVVQRAESLMGLFYLLTLYCFIRYAERDSAFGDGKVWAVLSVLSCLLGMATKEVMVSAPIMVFLYDRTFVSGSFREAWRRRKGVHLGLAGTWLLLGFLIVNAGERGGSVGFGHGVSGWHYALTQCRAIVLYLKLSLWPHPLVLDYGTSVSASLAGVWPQALLLAGLLAGTAWSLVHRPLFGFIGAWFFLILAPTSSIVPLPWQTIAEHRMYLPLAAILTLAVLGIRRLPARPSLIVIMVLAAGLGAMTARRNWDYRSEAAIWADAVAKLPGNPRAHYNLGVVLDRSHDPAGAMALYEEALRLEPGYAEAHNNLAVLLAGIPGRIPEALAHYEEALRLKPDYAETHNNLANALAGIPGRMPEAIAQFEEALRLMPDYADAHYNLGNALAGIPGRVSEAIAHYEAALRLEPDYADAHNNLANALAGVPGRVPEAIAHYEAALRLEPDLAEAHYNLANVLAGIPGRVPEAIAHYEEALRLEPDYVEAHYNLAMLCAKTGRLDETVIHLEMVLKLNPAFRGVRDTLERLRALRKP
jgi:tetratricopeptide (TPR) repeat protein